MIRYLKGELNAKYDGLVVVDVGGIGYEVNVPTNSPLFLREVGEPIKVYTYMQVREDDISFFGFASEGELQLFRLLITVNSVGAKGALAILSSGSISEIKKAIIFEDVDMIVRANGVGKKTAQKIILELQDKVGDNITKDGIDIAVSPNNTNFSDDKTVAIDALINLGYSRSEAASALVGAEDGLSVEEYITVALKSRG